MSGTKLFLLITIITLCLVLLLFILIYFLWNKSKTVKSQGVLDKIQIITAAIALVIGTSATVGSAVSTLQIASLGLEISKSQEKRDKRELIEEKVSNAITIYSEIIVSIGDVYASGLSLNSSFQEVSKGKIEEDVTTDLKFELINLANNLDKLSKSIKMLAKDDFSNYCFQNNASRISGKLKEMKKELIVLGESESAVHVDITNLSDIRSFIDIASNKIRHGSYILLLDSRMNTRLPDTEIFKLPYNNATVRHFFFTGNLIFSRREIPNQSGNSFVASFGSAILHDLIRSIPSSDEIKESLLSRYNGLIEEKDLKLVEYNPDNILSSGLKMALDDTEDIGNLYLLIGNSKL